MNKTIGIVAIFAILTIVSLINYIWSTKFGKANQFSKPNSNPLIYVTTREGLSSRFGQIERIHSNALLHNRTLTVVDNACVHYKDLTKPISLCEVFVFPTTINCIADSVESVVSNQKCTMPYLNSNNSEDHKWLLKPSNFGLDTFQNMDKKHPFQWNSTKCSLLYGYYFPLVRPEVNTLKVVFQQRYVNLFQSAWRNLQTHNRSSNVNATLSNLVVFHWRRGDQADRCNRHQDTSVNCETVDKFLIQVNESCSSIGGCASKLVYISTNENNPSNIRALRKRGFKTSQDIKKGKLMNVNSLELFTVELQLMIAAQHFFSWGTTGVRFFVSTARLQRSVSQNNDVVNKTLAITE